MPVSEEPTALDGRITSLDVVRGFALWGVLLINMLNFAGTPSGPPDAAAGWIATLFFQHKSWRLFSFLFGLGFAIQMTRGGDGFLPRYLRRLAVLLLFGLANFLFYFGDVLAPYALLGVLLLVARRWPPRLLVVTAMVLLAVHPLSMRVPSAPGGTAPAASGPPGRPPEGGFVVDLWRAQAAHISEHLDPTRHLVGSESWLLYFAMFLLGLYAGRRQLWDVNQHELLLSRAWRVGFPLGLGAMILYVVLLSMEGPYPPVLGMLVSGLWAYGATALSLSYAAGLVLLLRHERWRRLLQPLGDMGRMALTVYLSQTVIFTTIFFEYGLGLDQRLGPAAIFGVAAVIFAAQLVICTWWAKRFRFGPAEWLWRSLTYLRVQPFLR